MILANVCGKKGNRSDEMLHWCLLWWERIHLHSSFVFMKFNFAYSMYLFSYSMIEWYSHYSKEPLDWKYEKFITKISKKKKTIQNHCKLINEFHFKWKLFAKILIEILASVAERLTVKFDCCHYYCFIKYTCHIRRELPLKKKTFKRGDIFTNNLFVLLTILIT